MTDAVGALLQGAGAGALLGGPAGAAVGAIAGAIPGVLSLLAANRTINTYVATVDDVAATAAVAGAICDGLKHKQVVIHDDFRLLPEGAVRRKSLHLETLRYQLIGKKLGMAAEVKADLQGAAGVRSALIDTLLAAMSAFSANVTVVPPGGARSPLAAAALREQMHGDEPSIRYVLLIKATAGSSSQVIDQRPLWFADRFTTVSSLGLTYLMIDTKSSSVVCGGSVGASAGLYGSVGSKFEVQPIAISDI